MPTRRLHQLRGDANKTCHQDAASEAPLWVVDVGAGELRLVHGSDALKALVAKHALTKTVRVYALSAASKALGDIPELQTTFESRSDARPTTPEIEPEAARAAPEAPPAQPEAARAAPEAPPAQPAVIPAAPLIALAQAAAEDAEAVGSNLARDDDFSLFDRPFDDGDYFEEPPRARWVRAAGVAALVILLGGGGYRLVHSRSATRSPAHGPERPTAAIAVAATAVAEPAVVAPAPVAALTAPAAVAEQVPAAAAAAEPAPADPAAVVAPADPAAVVAPADPASPPAAPAPSTSYSELVAAGQRQFEGGHGKRAQELFEQALAETPDGTAALIGLAYVHLDRGRLQQATALFQRALVQDRGNPVAMFGLAESHRQEGNRRAALDEFKTFLTLQSAGSDADIARRLVEELANGG